MQFDSWSAFWDMGGYGFFVWLAFAVTIIAMVAIVVESIWARKALVAEVHKAFARRERIKAARKKSSVQDKSNSSEEVVN